MLEDTFDTKEADKLNRWRWTPIEEARSSNVKGFPELQPIEDSGIAASWKLLGSLPEDPRSLRTLLEVGGVSVVTWGDYAEASLAALFKELNLGASRLERDALTGKLRRVIPSKLVQMMVGQGAEPSGMIDRMLHVPDSVSGQMTMPHARSMVNFNADMGLFELEHSDVTSYPGLPCCHQTKQLQFVHRSDSELRNSIETMDEGPTSNDRLTSPGDEGTGRNGQLPRLLNGNAASQVQEMQLSKRAADSRSPSPGCSCMSLLRRHCG